MAQSVGADQIIALCADFAHYGELYQEYRILGVKAHVIPAYGVTPSIYPAVSTGNVIPPIQIAAFSGISSTSAVAFSVQELADAQGMRYIAGAGPKTLVGTASANMNPTANLWFQTGGSVSAVANIGCVWSFAATCPSAFNGQVIWHTLFEWDIEFRGAL